MILIHASELYSSMIAPFAASIVLLFGLSKMRRLLVLPLDYCFTLPHLKTASTSVWAPILTSSACNTFTIPSFHLHKEFQSGPICPVRTAHIGWDGTDVRDPPGEPGVEGWFALHSIHRIEPLDVVDNASDSLRELPHRFV
jgi:hypothetical protein